MPSESEIWLSEVANSEAWNQLALAAAAGDQQAFAALYRDADGFVRNFGRRRFRLRAGEVDDYSQDVWATVARKLHEFNPSKAGFRTWLAWQARAAGSECARKGAKLDKQQDNQFMEHDPVSADSELELSEEFDMLVACTTEQRAQMLRMRYVMGMWPSEIAQSMGIRPVAVWARLNRALDDVREALASGNSARRGPPTPPLPWWPEAREQPSPAGRARRSR